MIDSIEHPSSRPVDEWLRHFELFVLNSVNQFFDSLQETLDDVSHFWQDKEQRKEEAILDIDDAIELKDYLNTDLMVTNDSQVRLPSLKKLI